MNAVVYRARRDESSGDVIVDWAITCSLDELDTHLQNGWHPREDIAREKFAASEAAAVERELAVEPMSSDESPDETPDKVPALALRRPPKRKATKKK